MTCVDRPFGELRAEVLRNLEAAAAASPAARPGGRSRDRDRRRVEQRLAAIGCRRAACRSPAARPRPRRRRLTASTLNALMRARDAPALSASSSSCARWSMANAISVGQRVAPRGRPVDVIEVGVRARSAWCLLPYLQEELQLGPGRIFRRAEQARHGEGAAGIGPGRAGRSGSPVSQPRRKPDMKASPAPSTL